jgi:(p)ppGpp synthase/HD superfamily hydrolase
MILTHRLQEAINAASRLHRDQIRKDADKTPYISHVVGVMILLSSATHDEDVLIAGLLHDALEDVEDYTPELLEAQFGTRVKDIVMGVTEEFKLRNEVPPSWKEEKLLYLETLRRASDDSLMVSLADKIQNTRSLIEMITATKGQEHPKFASTHSDRVWFHQEVLTLGEERLGEDSVLVEELRSELGEMKRVLETFA